MASKHDVIIITRLLLRDLVVYLKSNNNVNVKSFIRSLAVGVYPPELRQLEGVKLAYSKFMTLSFEEDMQITFDKNDIYNKIPSIEGLYATDVFWWKNKRKFMDLEGNMTKKKNLPAWEREFESILINRMIDYIIENEEHRKNKSSSELRGIILLNKTNPEVFGEIVPDRTKGIPICHLSTEIM